MMKIKLDYVFMALVVILIFVMIVATGGFLSVREKIAQIQAEGIEDCYGVQCEYNLIGKVSCWTEPVMKPNYTVFDSWGLNESQGILGSEE